MVGSKSFRINDKHVVHEAFEGEVLAINLDTGTYYSLPGVSAQIWSCLVTGATIEAVTQALADSYEGDRNAIISAVAEFIGKMSVENLIVSCDASSTAPTCELPLSGHEKKPFVPPIMEIYSDMQDLLLLDPIHEVDDTGWPTINPLVSKEAKT